YIFSDYLNQAKKSFFRIFKQLFLNQLIYSIMKTRMVTLILLLFLLSCSQPSKKENNSKYTDNATTLYSKINSETSQLNFTNVIKEDVDFNFLNYTYIYVGGGVAVGDIDNDGLQDLYFVSSMGANKLYKNKGDLKFED